MTGSRERQPRVLMFAPLCYPPAGSEAIVTSKLVLAFREAGWDIDVITETDFGHYYPDEGVPEWREVERVVHQVAGAIGGAPSVVRIMLNRMRSLVWTRRSLRLGTAMARSRPYDVILSRAAPQYGHLPALFLSRRLNIPWIANWSDPMPPRRAPRPYGEGAEAPLFTAERLSLRAVGNRASWHTFPCERLMRYMCAYLPHADTKSSVIPHIALQRFRSNAAVPRERFTLCHAGSLSQRDPSVFLDGVKLFLAGSAEPVPLSITFIGLPLDGLREAARRRGLGQVVITKDVQDYRTVQETLARSAVLVILEADCAEGIFFPSKFVDYVQTGRPIFAVSPVAGTLADILSCDGGGIAADCRSSQSVALGLRTLYSAWRDGTLDASYGSDRLFSRFGEGAILGHYREIIARVSG